MYYTSTLYDTLCNTSLSTWIRLTIVSWEAESLTIQYTVNKVPLSLKNVLSCNETTH